MKNNNGKYRLQNKKTKAIYDVDADAMMRLTRSGKIRRYIILPPEDLVLVEFTKPVLVGDHEPPNVVSTTEDSGLSWDYVKEESQEEIITSQQKQKRKKKSDDKT